MTEQTSLQTDVPDELTTLKARATQMGIYFHPSIGVEKLKEKINGKLSPSTESSEPKKVAANTRTYLTDAEYKKSQVIRRKRDASKLVRCRITCMNPAKKEWEGEIISVGSAKLGTFKKYVLFNEVYHIPHIIYEAMKDRKFSHFSTVKNHLGVKVRKSKLVNEFNIEILPPLTKEELKDLAQQQAMAGSIDRPE